MKRPLLVKPTHAPPTPQNSNVPYLLAVIGVVFVVGAFAVAVIAFRPDADAVIVLTLSFGFASSIIGSIFSMLKSQETKVQSKETYLMVNSRLTEMMEHATDAANAQGQLTGQSNANKRNDELANKNDGR